MKTNLQHSDGIGGKCPGCEDCNPRVARAEPSRADAFWVVERFENGRSAGYWGGGSSRDFQMDIDKAVQFRRKEDAFWATRGWHWKDVKLTEHLMMDSLASPPEAQESAPVARAETSRGAPDARDSINCPWMSSIDNRLARCTRFNGHSGSCDFELVPEVADQLLHKQIDADKAWQFLQSKSVPNLDIKRPGLLCKVTLVELLAGFADERYKSTLNAAASNIKSLQKLAENQKEEFGDALRGHVVLLEALRLAHRYFLQSNKLTVDDWEMLDEMWAAIKQAERT